MMNTQIEARRFSVAEHPHVVVHNDFGTIRVSRGDLGDEVVIQATKRNRIFSSATDGIQISCEQDAESNEITVKAWRENISLANSTAEVDIDIAVPDHVDLTLISRAGTVTVTDLSGQMILSSKAGTITARNCVLTGNSHLSTEAGTVHFEGTLDPHGASEFMTRLGTVQVILLNTPGFHLDATTDLGSITTNIPSMIVARPNLLNSEVHADVGDLPHAKLTLESKLGSIDLQVRAAERRPESVSESQFALG